jgi:hypothetical protein
MSKEMTEAGKSESQTCISGKGTEIWQTLSAKSEALKVRHKKSETVSRIFKATRGRCY